VQVFGCITAFRPRVANDRFVFPVAFQTSQPVLSTNLYEPTSFTAVEQPETLTSCCSFAPMCYWTRMILSQGIVPPNGYIWLDTTNKTSDASLLHNLVKPGRPEHPTGRPAQPVSPLGPRKLAHGRQSSFPRNLRTRSLIGVSTAASNTLRNSMQTNCFFE
jgi:hypothetical protein